MTKSRVKWAGNVACMGVLVRKSLDKRPLEDVVVVGRTILRRLLHEQAGCNLDSSGLGQEQVVGPCKHGNEPSGCIKYRNFSTK